MSPPGSPWENGYAESFHSKLRDEFLSRVEFENAVDVRHQTTPWREEHNEHRLFEYLTHSAFARRTQALVQKMGVRHPPSSSDRRQRTESLSSCQ